MILGNCKFFVSEKKAMFFFLRKNWYLLRNFTKLVTFYGKFAIIWGFKKFKFRIRTLPGQLVRKRRKNAPLSVEDFFPYYEKGRKRNVRVNKVGTDKPFTTTDRKILPTKQILKHFKQDNRIAPEYLPPSNSIKHLF